MAYSQYFGSPAIMTSTANTELIVQTEQRTKVACVFRFVNIQACTVKINGGDPIYLEAGNEFEVDREDPFITSFIVVESEIQYYFSGIYR
jgi:hypothetical protein